MTKNDNDIFYLKFLHRIQYFWEYLKDFHRYPYVLEGEVHNTNSAQTILMLLAAAQIRT